MNKCDDPRHIQHVKRVREAFRTSWWLQWSKQGASQDPSGLCRKYRTQISIFGIVKRCIARLGSTGVSAAIDAAVELGAPQVIYVVRITLSEGVRLSSDVIPLLFRRGLLMMCTVI